MAHGRSKLHNPGRGRLLLAMAAVCVCTLALCHQGFPGGFPGGFSGKVVIELLDEVEFAYKLRLLDDFAFTDAGGKVWLARKGAILDGENFPAELHILNGLPYLAEYRKAAVIHDYFCRARSESWRQVHRTLYHASVVEGVTETQAKALYAVVYAGGWRWEPNGSSCYRSCHAAAVSLAWRPAINPEALQPVLQWIAHDLPTLDEIDSRLDGVITRPGPHLFAQR